MTDYDDMDGPELAERVAIEVMGWDDFERWSRAGQGGFRPDRDWAAAGEVLEKMGDHLVEMARYPTGRWKVALHERAKMGIEPRVFAAKADTAPRAICLAALKARAAFIQWEDIGIKPSAKGLPADGEA